MSLMSWLSKVRKPGPPRKQIVYFAQGGAAERVLRRYPNYLVLRR